MEFRKLLPLAVVLVVLVVVGVALQSRPTSRAITEEAGLRRLFPNDELVKEAASVSVTLGTTTAGALRLERAEDKSWRVASLFGVPADGPKVEKFLGTLKDLEGEYRAQGGEVHDAFALTEARALRVTCGAAQGEKPLAELLVGKKAGYSTGFVRRAGAEEVFLVNVNLRSELGLTGDETDQAPPASHFMAKRFVNVDPAQVASVAMTWPDKELVLDYRKYLVEKPAEPSSAPTTAATVPASAPASRVTTEYRWTVASGRTAGFNEKAVEPFLRALGELEAKDAKDPAAPAAVGLDKPGYRLLLTLKDGKKFGLEASRPTLAGPAYGRVDNGSAIYEVEGYGFDRAFPKGRELFTLPSLAVKEDELLELTVKTTGGRFVLKRDGAGKWSLVEPSGLTVDEGKVTDVGSSLAGLQVEDYVDKPSPQEQRELEAAATKVTYKTKDGATRSITFGPSSRVTEGFVARADGVDGLVVISKWAADRLLVAPSALEKKAPAPAGSPAPPDGE